ncbi:MAG TPA: DUF3501 family protein [Propylenella sp.]
MAGTRRWTAPPRPVPPRRRRGDGDHGGRGETLKGEPEHDVDRTTAEGKASSVQFIHFPLTDAQAARFKTPGTRTVLSIGHPEYGHSAVVLERVRAALAQDLD